MAVDHDAVYRQKARQYDALVRCEDMYEQILPQLRQSVGVMGGQVVELGAGTGRLTRMLAGLARSVLAFDRSIAMLGQARAAAEREGWRHTHLALADHRSLPLPDGGADAVVSGWSLCYVATRSGAEWRMAVRQAVDEMRRVARCGASLVVFETLGTGCETPNPPQKLLPYLQFLSELGFTKSCIRTDYQFASVQEAAAQMAFFFGPALADWVIAEQRRVVPECTAVFRLLV